MHGRTTVCSVPGCPHLTPCPVHPRTERGRKHRRAGAHVLTATHCAVCGVKFTKHNPPTRGHIKARSMGGKDVPENYRAECEACNKGNREV